MCFVKIDIKTWSRAKTYMHYMTDIPCTYSMCINIDISRLMERVAKSKLKLFPVCLYGISRIVNQHREFRMALDAQGNLGYYSLTNPCYTVFHEEIEAFTDVWTKYSEDFNAFYQNYMDDIAQYKNEQCMGKPVVDANIFNVSCIPWTSFTGFNLNLQNGYDYLPPIFTIGKYFEEGGKMLLPLAIQVHHAVCDGFHTARFVNELQDWADTF